MYIAHKVTSAVTARHLCICMSGLQVFIRTHRVYSNQQFIIGVYLEHMQSLAPTDPHWARLVGYGPFSGSLCVIHKESLCLSSGDINKVNVGTYLSI
jgi:hypothetical protein